jgi:cobalt-zinc-cadmium efflux system membrane fusion protein
MKKHLYCLTFLFLILPSFTLLAVGCVDGSATQETSGVDAPEEHPDTGSHAGHAHAQADAHEGVDPLDWCLEHAVPESQCTACDASLIAGFKQTGDWCAEHDRPESHCRLCNPGLVFPQESLLRVQSIELADQEIGVTLNFRPNAAFCATDGALIQFASVNTAEKAGISVQSIRASERETVVEAPAEIQFDETTITAVTTSIGALVSRWLVSPGEIVSKGDVLAVLNSPEIAQLKSALVAAAAKYELERAELTRHTSLRDRNLVSPADWEQQSAKTALAGAEFAGSRSLLQAAGLDEADLADVLEHGGLSHQLVLRAPSDGAVIERVAQLGTLLAAGGTYATIGDPTALWIEARLTEQQMREVDIGQQLTFSSDGRAANQVSGRIIWLSRFLDPHTRTGTVRARVVGTDHRLRAGEFGRVRITGRSDETVSLVPREAVQWEGCCNVVFVREAIDRYRPRKVQIIDFDGPYYQVAEDVRVGEEVVVGGAFLLKTELKKSSIGAGCCGLEAIG